MDRFATLEKTLQTVKQRMHPKLYGPDVRCYARTHVI